MVSNDKEARGVQIDNRLHEINWIAGVTICHRIENI